MRSLLKQLKLKRANFFRYDLAPIFRNERFDPYFKGDSMLARDGTVPGARHHG